MKIEMSMRKARIMTIDDEQLVCRSIKVRLRMAGFFKIESVNDSTKAFDRICEYHPDLILLDIHMPEVTGLEILDQVLELPNAPTVIMLSAADMETKYNALERGAYDFINKPIDSQELFVRVRRALLEQQKLDSPVDNNRSAGTKS